MSDNIINNNLQDDDQETETEAVETISLNDFPTAEDHDGSTVQDHRNSPPSTATEDFFEFFRGGLSENSNDKSMSHAEDIIFCGKLVPVNDQILRNESPSQTKTKVTNKISLITAELLEESENENTENSVNFSSIPRNRDTPTGYHRLRHNQSVGCQRSWSDSMAGVKLATTSPPVRTSRSLDYKKLNQMSSMSSEPTTDISSDGSGKKTPSSSSRWYVLLFGLVKVPPSEMDIKDIKNRQVRQTGSKTPVFGPSESFKVVPVSQSVDHRKCSWRILGFLSCKSSSSADVANPVGYMPKV
ncbi:uncharacterized protein LOC143532628 [Bidens hawaiensis]|uniref:uncharacterized protein LOC143532628 n=1 Tax=Bidens hawaiensis TaxID=980011 RepID=UPI00404A7207